MRVLIKDISRPLPLQLQCSYQGQQGDGSQSVRGNYKPRFCGGQNLTVVKRNASVYQVNPVSRMTGEGRAEVLRVWGPGFDQKGAGVRGGACEAAQFGRGNYKSFKGITLTVLERMHQFIMHIL